MLAYNFIVNIETNVYFLKELINLPKAIKSAYDADNKYIASVDGVPISHHIYA